MSIFLLGYWKMDEGSGLTLNDTSGAGNTATINTGASVVWTANNINTGATTPVWQGTGYAQAANAAPTNFDGTTPFSVVIWMSDIAPVGVYVGNFGTGLQGWALSMNVFTGAGNQFEFTLANNTGTNNFLRKTNRATISVSGTFMLSVTYDGSQTAAGVNLYIGATHTILDVVRQDTLTATSASGIPITFGESPVGSNAYTGGLAYVQIYSGVLSGSQIGTLAAAPGTVFGNGVLGIVNPGMDGNMRPQLKGGLNA